MLGHSGTPCLLPVLPCLKTISEIIAPKANSQTPNRLVVKISQWRAYLHNLIQIRGGVWRMLKLIVFHYSLECLH